MAKTRITPDEIAYMLNFGREMTRRMESLSLEPTQVAGRSDGGVSSTYISDIRRAVLGKSEKYFRPSRDKVIAIAKALGWPEHEALEIAGHSTSNTQSATMKLPDDAREILAYFLSFTSTQRKDFLVAFRAIAELHRKESSLIQLEFENLPIIDGSDAPPQPELPESHGILI